MSFVTAKSRFTRLDAFTKTVDEARIRTTSGGVVTIVSLLVVVFLAWGEWADYRRVVIHPELIVDKGRGMYSDSHLFSIDCQCCGRVGDGQSRLEVANNISCR